MSKFLYVDYTLDGESGDVLLEGDHRQTNERMILNGVEELTGEEVSQVKPAEKYETRSSHKTFIVEETELIEPGDVQDRKQGTVTLVVNDTVMDPASRANYSGRTPNA
ncbi:MAG: hypothetical protein ABEK50_18275 [bacterium]